ncbi:MAG: putative iron-regulated protein [Sulfurimonas sp.]|jgi:putative iron-regulated protein|uniref:imelysin family protein n=1 Tax=Sulfurimonas sp. TaxID=2022749 RepID=UPI0039E705C4
MIKTKILGSIALTAILALGISGCSGGGGDTETLGGTTTTQTEATGISAANKTIALTTYANIALANYTDALYDASNLNTALDTFVSSPNDTTLQAAKNAWKSARISYGTTEIFRLADGPIDAAEGFAATFGAPEGQLNAWPLDENMIDYTTAASGAVTSGNIIDTVGVFTPSGSEATSVDVTTITKETLSALNENGGDANIATGYHAVEFLLWGQDQDYNSFLDDTITNGATTAGLRNVTDYTSAANADRRKDYLVAASELIVDDLQLMVDAWTSVTGSYREAFLASGSNAIATNTALKQIFISMGTFVKSELANERMAVAILTPSEEDEHSCFSDNTHVDVDKNYRGFVNVLKGEYKGSLQGTSFYSLLPQTNKDTLDTFISSIETKITAMNNAVTSEHFDYQIKDGSSNKDNLVSIKNELRELGDEMVTVATEFDISLSTDDVTDADETQL